MDKVRINRSFKFTGYRAYHEVLPQISSLVHSDFASEHVRFILAMNEAVCNAAAYSLKGPLNVEIKIDAEIFDNMFTVTVRSDTRNWNAIEYKDKLLKLLDDNKVSKMDWIDYLGTNPVSRGIWIMLSGADTVILDEKGRFVRLICFLSKKTDKDEEGSISISDILPKLYVERDGTLI